MSSNKQQQITCPECGTIGKFTMWRSINTVLDPEMKAKVRDKSAFAYKCPKCGKTVNVDYGFLYHQMEDKIMIQYAGIESLNDVVEFFDGMRKSDDSMLRGLTDAKYILRIVKTQNELLEKLKIFDAGYDDRIIELTKAVYSVQLRDDPKMKDLKEVLFAMEEEEPVLVLFSSDGTYFGTINMNPQLINRITEDFKTVLPPIREDNTYIVDFQWALQQFGRKNGKD